MKSKMFVILAVASLVAMLTPALEGQEQMLFRVSIPFEFVAGGVHLAAGDYLAFHATPTILKLVRADGRGSAWIAVKASPVIAKENRNQLVFNVYGADYFLASVQTGHDQQVHECFRCRTEVNLAAQYRRNDVKTVTIASK